MSELVLPKVFSFLPSWYETDSEEESELESEEESEPEDIYNDYFYKGKDNKFRKDGVLFSVQSEFVCYNCGGEVSHIISSGMLNIQVQPKNWSTEELYLYLRYQNNKDLSHNLEDYKEMEMRSVYRDRNYKELHIYYYPSDEDDNKGFKKKVSREYARLKDHYGECKRFNMELDKKYKEETDEGVLKDWLIDRLGDFFKCYITYTCKKRKCYESFGWQCNPMIVNFVLESKTDGDYNFVHHRDINNLYNDNYENDNIHVIPEDERSDPLEYQCYLFEPAKSDNYGILSGSGLRELDFRFTLNEKNYKEVIEGNSDLFVTKLNHYSSHKPDYRGMGWRFYPAICMMCIEHSKNSHKLDSETMRCEGGHDPKFYYIDKEVWEEVLKWDMDYNWDWKERRYDLPLVVGEYWEEDHKEKYEDLMLDYLFLFKYEKKINEYLGLIDELDFRGVNTQEIKEDMLKRLDSKLTWEGWLRVSGEYGIKKL